MVFNKFYNQMNSRYVVYICLFSVLVSQILSQNCLLVQNPANSSVCLANNQPNNSLVCCYYSGYSNNTNKTLNGCYPFFANQTSNATSFIQNNFNLTNVSTVCSYSATQIFSFFAVIALLIFSLF